MWENNVRWRPSPAWPPLFMEVGMNWRHKCNPAWLKARQYFLTASDVISLLPVTKTGRPRKITDEDYLRVYSRKLEDIHQDDAISIGAAARGHILEPYAIDELNKIVGTHFHHWDDVIVGDLSVLKAEYQLAFSPDGANSEMKKGTLCTLDRSKFCADEIVEVKSYSAEKHLSKLVTPSKMLEERWQVAVAMAVSSQILHAHVVFYNPNLYSDNLIVFSYSRTDLLDEIRCVLNVRDDFNNFVTRFNKGYASDANRFDGKINERSIIKMEFEKEISKNLNPKGM